MTVNDEKLTIFPARSIITMERAMPRASAIAIKGDRIVEVGSIETMQPWLDNRPFEIDDRFRDKVIMPGFIDPHLHPSMAAILLNMHFITALEWQLPWQRVPAVKTPEAFQARLEELVSKDAGREPIFTWGHHPIWHGEVNRAGLDELSPDRPLIVWHRGYHSLVVNTAALKWMQIDEDNARRHIHVDLERGYFCETGLSVAFRSINRYVLDKERFTAGLERLKQVVHLGGHTTIGDMATGMYDFDLEWGSLKSVFERDDTPFRIDLIPTHGAFGGRGGPPNDEQLDAIVNARSMNTHRLRFGNQIKMFSDGGFFAELMQLGEPGFIDPLHHGEWLTPPETFEATARAYWNRGLHVHVHCTGDLGLELALDTLAKLLDERPRFDHRFTIEHLGVSTPEQARRMAALGAAASVNVYYVHELSDSFYKHVLGYERASQMSRLGTLMENGITTAIHSDYTMSPAMPLFNAWVAANRITEAGTVMGASERLTLDQALQTITTNAAFVLGRENEIGTLRAGKYADFTVLDADPYDLPIDELKDIPVHGTVFEGKPYDLPR